MRIKKFLLVFVLTFFVKFGFGQVYQSMPQYGYGPIKRMDIDSSLTIPTTCGVPSIRTNLTRKSAIAFDTCNNRFYYYNSKTLVWDTIKGGGSTIDTSNQFVNSVTKVNDSTIRVIKGTTTTDIVINPQATRLVTEVYNKTGSPISKGAVVYIDGKHSNNQPSIALATGNNEANSYKTFALVADDIPNMSSGYVIQAGTITGLNLPTSTYTDGDILYLSPTVAGGYTTIKPLAPSHIVKLGSIVNAHPTQGRIEVKIENGWQLDELSDVSIPAVPADSVLLQFSRVDSLWHDVSPTTAIGSRYIKPSDTASMLTNYAKTSAVNLKVNISDTATMLSTYLRSISGVKYSDTATMLTPYLRKIDTASLSTRINAKFTLPTLTNGSVLFSNGTTISQNNTRLFWDNTNNRLGVGTSSPSTTLHVNASVTASSALARIGLINGTLTAAANNDVLAGLDVSPTFSNGAFTGVGNYALRLGGHIGFGTNNAFGFNYANFNALTSNNGIAANFTPSGTPTGLPYVFQFNKTSGTTNVNALLFVGGGSAGSGNSANKHVISTTADGTASSQPIVIRAASTGTNWGSVNDHLTLFATGNVVIQNASASATDAGYRLDVNGTVRSTQFYLSALNTAPATASSTGTTGEIRIDANYIYICTATNTWKRVAIATW